MVFTGRPTGQYQTVPYSRPPVARAWDLPGGSAGGYGSSHGANNGGPTMPNMYARPSIAEQLAQRNYLEAYENTRQRPRYPRSPLSILFGIGY